MSRPPKDLDANDQIPVEHELRVVLAWAKQAGFVYVATAVRRALTELETRR